MWYYVRLPMPGHNIMLLLPRSKVSPHRYYSFHVVPVMQYAFNHVCTIVTLHISIITPGPQEKWGQRLVYWPLKDLQKLFNSTVRVQLSDCLLMWCISSRVPLNRQRGRSKVPLHRVVTQIKPLAVTWGSIWLLMFTASVALSGGPVRRVMCGGRQKTSVLLRLISVAECQVWYGGVWPVWALCHSLLWAQAVHLCRLQGLHKINKMPTVVMVGNFSPDKVCVYEQVRQC